MTDRTPNRPNDKRIRADAWADTADAARRMPSPPEGYRDHRRETDFSRALRYGGPMPEYRADMGTGTTAAGGALVRPSFLAEVLLSLQFASAFGKARTWLSTDETGKLTGAPAKYPLNLADAAAQSASAVSENTSIAGTATDPTFAQLSFSECPTYSAALDKVSTSLVEDSSVDLEAVFAEQGARRMARAIDAQFAAAITAAATVKVTTAGATAVTAGDFFNLMTSLDQSVRGQSIFVCSPGASKTLLNATDASGRLLAQAVPFVPFADDFAQTFGSTAPSRTINVMSLAGVAILESKAFAAPTAGAVTGCLIDVHQALILRCAGLELVRIGERFADTAEVAWTLLGRFDPQVADLNAVCLLTQHA